MSEENEEYFVSKEQMFFQAMKVAAYANNEITRLREENKKLRATFRVNMLRAFPHMSHDEIDAEIAAAIRESENETI